MTDSKINSATACFSNKVSEPSVDAETEPLRGEHYRDI